MEPMTAILNGMVSTSARSYDPKAACQRRCDAENQRHGSLNEYDGYNCDKCRNKGYVLLPKEYDGLWQEIQATCRCMKVRRTIRTMKNSGLENVVHDYTFDKFVATEDWQREMLDKAKRHTLENWFFIGGQTGAGKSHICSALAIKHLKKGNEVKYMMWQDDAKKLKAKVNDDDYCRLIASYKDVDLLYIDDLFKVGKTSSQMAQKPTTADINLAYEILNSRYVSKKPTIISSECTLLDILDIDEAIGGRIKQRCGEFSISLQRDTNKNYRLR